MRLLCSIATLCALAGAAPAMELPDCALIPGSPDSCSPIVACMPGEDSYFVGRAIGWDEGTLSGVTNTGIICIGTWRVTGLGVGLARFACDDGLEGRLVYYYQDGETGTTHGRGLISGFGFVEAWSGHNIEQFLDQTGRRVDGELMCGAAPMLMS
ncbi:MAG: Protein of unknown function (DUF1358) [Roseibaca calidilacus]|uniref:Uncharacterized protein n=1 Tax=Roseibaca calidilacus TaxID=1666912 RepID=A0A0P7WCM2_9RHOB|nr:hypothetical protein [Roseibaca calidilacus]KPP95744.1 MAG: Protein of unknown function (DUF1358) [Roseibaca calidilacus]CUX81780.1 hypothetical protein Ga0058931_1974 [Roseibaca calidilacus]